MFPNINAVAAKFLSTTLLISVLTWIVPEQVVVHLRLRGSPQVMLWAWERAEDISGFPDSDNIGVAFLAATINVAGPNFIVHHRAQPLYAPKHYLMPVVRIETSRKDPPSFSPEQLDGVVAQILEIAANPKTHGLQIDFDANKEQRNVYKVILTRLRKALPPEMPLSITAIASWCAGDYWLSGLPVDEVVPMYFDMGVKESMKWQYFQYISDNATSGRAGNCKCHGAFGLSTSEAVPFTATQYKGKRIYFFSTHPWQMLSNQAKNDITKILKYTEAS